MRKAVFALMLVVTALAAGATFAGTTAREKNGPVAFSRFRFVDSPVRREIWVANPDGSGQRRLTHVGPNYRDSNPNWAPDGSRLLFTRCAPLNGVPGAGRCTIWTVNADGSGERILSPQACSKLGPNCPDDGSPAFSSDGRSIAFGRFTGQGGDIAIGDSQLRHVRLVFPFGRVSGGPDTGGFTWSPDGKRIAFSVYNDNGPRFKPVNGRAIYVINADGTGLRRVTPWSLPAGDGNSLSWSPDGTRILFRTVTGDPGHPGPLYGNLYTIRPNGTDLRQLTHFPAGTRVELGSYSPDGRSIVFTTDAGATPKPDGSGSWTDVFTINADGTGLTPVTRTKNWEGTPAWGPG